jgi:dUTP pyrophosphatase
MTEYTLFIFTKNEELKNKYAEVLEKHNLQAVSKYPNAGFDLFCPEEIISNNKMIELNTQVVGAMFNTKTSDYIPMSYYLYPRSSICKTPLRFANSLGIIDASYRSSLLVKFDNNFNDDIVIDKYSRLVQICSPTLQSYKVVIADTLEELGLTTRCGGFGSTGGCLSMASK